MDRGWIISTENYYGRTSVVPFHSQNRCCLRRAALPSTAAPRLQDPLALAHSRICASALDEKLGRDGHSRTSVGTNHHDNDNTDTFVSDRRQRLPKPLRALRLLHFLDSSVKVIFCVKPRCLARLCGESLGHK